MGTVFATKLDSINQTVSAVFSADHASLASAMAQGANRPVYAVGSGGSVVVAEFLSQCRAQLGHGITSCVTPMSYVLQNCDPAAMAWFFSASGENQDIQAAFEFALHVSPSGLFVLTNNDQGALVSIAKEHGCTAFVSPVADAKDGFLATHSVVSSLLSLVLASDLLAGRQDGGTRQEELRGRIQSQLASIERERLVDSIGKKLDCETLLILHDPRLSAAAILVETSAWEAGLVNVQRTDFRNFAHGRHVWLDKHASATFVLSLTAEQSATSWMAIDKQLPESLHRATFSFDRAGRASQLEAVAFGLAFVDALGRVKGIDPGRPGVSDFGRRIFDDPSLREIAAKDELSVRRKRQAAIRADSEPSGLELNAGRSAFVAAIEADRFGGVVLDYDGTVVATDKRLDPPTEPILSELERLLDADIRVGFASGRGGSIGEMLRTSLPARYHPKVLVGYYNGALIAPLEIDIRSNPPNADPFLADARKRLVALPGLFRDGWTPKEAPLQLTIPRSMFVDEFKGPFWLAEELASLSVCVAQSGHSVDIFPAWASKCEVVRKIREKLVSPVSAILCVGDCGERTGNDYDLLEGPHGISVGKVCDRLHTCWNLAPNSSQGPAGLEQLLKALKVVDQGLTKLTVPYSFSFG